MSTIVLDPQAAEFHVPDLDADLSGGECRAGCAKAGEEGERARAATCRNT